MKWTDAKNIINSNPEVVKELEKNAVEYQVVREIVKARKELNLTQAQLAQLVGTKQSNISRLESGEYNPTIEFLSKIAQAMGKNLDIRLQ
jgi:predicted transcriptional regulator